MSGASVGLTGDFLIIAHYKYSCLLTYLLTYLLTDAIYIYYKHLWHVLQITGANQKIRSTIFVQTEIFVRRPRML